MYSLEEARVALKEVRNENITPNTIISVGITASEFAHTFLQSKTLEEDRKKSQKKRVYRKSLMAKTRN
jgi:hypothetical protein